jgi:hypothetical protein
MYLVDTNVISESRKGARANAGVREFFERTAIHQTPLYLSVVTVGELRRGVEVIRHRGDKVQAKQLEKWLEQLVKHYDDYPDVAQLWGRLRVPHHENALDKLIAATALIHNLTVVTRNQTDFAKTGVTVINPFS